MKFAEIFYSVSWISALSIIWFYTDTLLHYAQLLGIFTNLRLEYLAFVSLNYDKFFPDFLYEKSMQSDSANLRFLAKVVSCPLCMTAWLAIASGVFYKDFLIVGPIYILSLVVILQIKKWI